MYVHDARLEHCTHSVESKFIHGCATLLPNRVDLVPFWLPQSMSPSTAFLTDYFICLKFTVDTDILKPDTGALSIERPLHTSSKGSSERHSSGISTPKDSKLPYHEPVSEGEDDEDMALVPGQSHSMILHNHVLMPLHSEE